jgi:predicted aconitase with swiveling domain
MNLSGRIIFKGKATGEVLKTEQEISFYGGVDPDTGLISEREHELEGKSIAGKILVFPAGKGSTVGSYTLYRLKKNKKCPVAIINRTCETIVAVGCIISEIPCMDKIDIDKIPSGSQIQVDATNGIITLL